MVAFTAGNLVVYRVGATGSATAPTSAAAAVFLDEYTTTGVLVQSIAMPTADSGSNQMLTASGTSAEGFINRSEDGRYLVLTGYDAQVGTLNIANSSTAVGASQVLRVIGRVDSNGNVDTSTTTTAFSGGSIRSAVSADGTSFWAVGANTGVIYETLGSSTHTIVSSTFTTMRSIDIFGDQLYVSGSTGTLRIGAVGSGEPTATGQTISPLPGIPLGTSPNFTSPYQFVFADLTAAVPGVDTLYLADDRSIANGGGLYKFSLFEGSWVSNGVAAGSLSNGLRGLTGSVSGTTVTLYSTTAATTANALVRLIDSGGYNAAFSTTTLTSLTTAPANTVFRGIDFAPQAAAPALPTLNISDVTQAEGTTPGTTDFTFSVTLSAPAGPGGVTFDIATADGTAQDDNPAAEDNDYVARTLTGQTIPAGSTGPFQFTVTVNKDNIREGNETFFVNVTSITGATAGDAQGTGTITDDDTPILSIANVSQAEGNGGTSIFTFIVSLDRPAPFGGVTFDIATADSTATDADNDYEPLSLTTQTILEGATSYMFDVTVNGDTAVEPNELFLVNVTNVVGASVGDGQATGTIQNEDVPPIPVASVADVAVAEGNSGVTYLNFTVTLSFSPTGPVTIAYATSNGTATAGSDYLAVSGTLNFAAGETVKTVAVPVIGDTVLETSETLTLTLSNPTGATIGDGSAIGTITNDEGAGGGYYPLASGSFSEDWTNTGRITADDDWSGVPFIIGYLGDVSTSSTADVDPTSVSHQGPALGAVDVLANQTNPSAAGSGGVAEFQPHTTDPALNFVPNPTIALQGSGTADAPSIVLYMDSSGRTDVRLQASLRDIDYNADNAAQQINVQYRTNPTGNWTNVPGGHFTDVTTAGSATQTTALDVVLPAGANNSPTLQIRIMTVNAGSTDEWVGIDDIVVSSQGGPGLSIADAAAFEGTGGSSSIAFTVTRTGDTTGASSANWTITFAGGTFPASAGDLAATQSLTGSVAFAAGETSKTIVVALEPDAVPEADEGFTITLSSPTGASLTDASALGTIVNDDGSPPFVAISDVVQAEGNGGTSVFTFTVTRTGGTGAFTVQYTTVDGTATAGSDYVAASGMLSFGAGENSKPIEVTVTGDSAGEFDESFLVQLSNPTGNAVIADAAGTGTIVNDDPLYIHQIQGSSYYSPILAAEGKNGFNVVSSMIVTVQAVVTAVDNEGTRQGFYITEETGQWDSNPLTSEGLFVMAQYDTTDTSNPPPGTGTTLAALLTANGINPAGFAPGDLVTVTARVMEYQAFESLPRTVLWQVSSIIQNSTGNPVPVLTLDAGRPIPNSILTGVTPDLTDSVGNTFDASRYALSYFETVEGMLVKIPDMVVADGFVNTVGADNDPVFQAYSRVHADADQINSRGGYTIAGDPPLSPPDTADTDDGTIHGGRHLHDGDTNPDIIELDFSGFAMNYPAGLIGNMSMGDGLGDVTGIIDFDFTDRKLFVTSMNPGSYVDTVPARETTTLGNDDRALTIATFNVENLDAAEAATPAGAARLAGIANVIATNLNAPDIIIIEEIQDNNGADASGGADASLTWQALVNALNAAVPGANYQWVDQDPVAGADGGQPGGNIRVGFLYDTNRVQLGNLPANATIAERRQFTDRIGDGVRDAGDQILFSDDMIAAEINTSDWGGTRKSLLAQFSFHGQTVFVAANHFPSKIGDDTFWQFNQNLEAGRPTNADFVQRNNVANDLYAMLNHIAGNAPGAGIVAGGDYNEFYFYRALEVATGYVLPDGTARAGGARFDNLTVTHLPEAERYSYTFDGRSQTLDHIVVNSMLNGVATYDVVHVNTGYSSFGTGANDDPSISDHDPAVASFNFASLSETLVGTPNRDVFRLEQGGDDHVSGLGGNDTFYFGGAFDENDFVDGDGGVDSIILDGIYLDLVLGTGVVSNIVGIETISLVPGLSVAYDNNNENSNRYNITMLDSNVGTGGVFKVNGYYLGANESFTFDGSAESDAKFILFAGQGIDNLTGGGGNDEFIFGHDGRFSANDSVVGGGGYDSVYLRGDYTIDFNDPAWADVLSGIESVTLGGFNDPRYLSGGDGEFDYAIVWNDAMLAGGAITFNGSRLGEAESMSFDGTQEATARFRLFGGAGNDVLRGGGGNDMIYGGGLGDTLAGRGGNDVFAYYSVSESNSVERDGIQDFTLGDLIDLSVIDANVNLPGNQAFVFGTGPVSAGQLRVTGVGPIYLVQGYVDDDLIADLEISVTVTNLHILTGSDFIL